MSSDSSSTDAVSGHEHATTSIKKLTDVETATGHELFTVGYPVSETPIQDLTNAYLRASQQLSTLRQGRYAYAQDWNVLADYAKAIINVLVNLFDTLYARGYIEYAYLYDRVLECQRILSTYKYLRTGDVIMPEHTNTLIDVARCLGETSVEYLYEEVKWLLPTRKLAREIVLVDTDDWATARRYVTDGTIVFIHHTTKALTPREVYTIVDRRRVVLALLLDYESIFHRGVDPCVRAFYGVFYNVECHPSCSITSGCIDIVDPSFPLWSGFYGCVDLRAYPYCLLGGIWDDTIHADYKVSHARPWGIGSCGYAYAKYRRGAIIELPYRGLWFQLEVLDFCIGAIAHLLLGEKNRCYIAKRGTKLQRIVWMAYYDSPVGRGLDCRTVDQCLKELASRGGWRLIDLRKR